MSLLDTDQWPHTVAFARTEVVIDNSGGSTISSPTTYASVPAWVQPASEAEIFEFAKKDQRVTHTILLESDPGVHLNDQITVTAAIAGADYDGVVLQAKSFGGGDVGLGILFQVFAETYREQSAK